MAEDHLQRVRHVDLERLEQRARADAGRTQVMNSDQRDLEIHLPFVPKVWLSLARVILYRVVGCSMRLHV